MNFDEEGKEQVNIRFNIINILVYLIGIILIVQLFNLQVVHGESYREQSNTRLSRSSVIKAARGSILDRSGNELAGVKTENNIEIYKTNISDEELNKSVLNLVELLNKYEIGYDDTFPVKINPFEFTISGDELTNWKKKYKIAEDATAEEAFYKFKNKYEITNDNVEEIRKIISIRYIITTTGYSATKSITIATNVNEEVVAQISERNSDFPGVSISTNAARTYLAGNLAAHVIGYTGKIKEDEYNANKDTYNIDDIIGKTGIEYVFEKYLKGTDGEKQVEMSVDGTITGETVAKNAIAGSDVVLTIDSNLQKVTQDSLENCINKIRSGGFAQTYDAQGGAAVVMNVNTGEVLATASYPTFEPQWFVGGISQENWAYLRDDSRHPQLNKTIQSTYEPGSTFKMVTAIAGLETGAITTKERINDTGVYRKYNMEWKCWYYTSYHRGHGYQNVTQALQHSCNYFFYETGDRMGIDNLSKYALHFGLGKKTGIELPNEKEGAVASKETYAKLRNGGRIGPGDVLNASIGQGDNNFTPMQIAKYISSIANGGNVVKPTIVKSILNSDGSEVSRDEITQYTNEKLGYSDTDDGITISQESVNVAKEGMRMAASEAGGTAYNIFKGFNQEVAGKTGSAEAGKDKDGNDLVNAWFVCFAPYEKPEVAVVVMIENGGHGNYAAEVARDVLTQYFGMNESTEINESMTATPFVEQIR
ncbi:MAG: penicillin-binding protein 2 [Clostridium sp. 28_12]|nr:MAG: penicillin-binding protein 2 [Clostridium sp. 28_12]